MSRPPSENQPICAPKTNCAAILAAKTFGSDRKSSRKNSAPTGSTYPLENRQSQRKRESERRGGEGRRVAGYPYTAWNAGVMIVWPGPPGRSPVAKPTKVRNRLMPPMNGSEFDSVSRIFVPPAAARTCRSIGRERDGEAGGAECVCVCVSSCTIHYLGHVRVLEL